MSPIPTPPNQYFWSRQCKRNKGISNLAYLIADKYGQSNRALTELAATLYNIGNVNELHILFNITRRKANIKKSIAIMEKKFRDAIQKRFALHTWDGK